MRPGLLLVWAARQACWPVPELVQVAWQVRMPVPEQRMLVELPEQAPRAIGMMVDVLVEQQLGWGQGRDPEPSADALHDPR